jgi:hypothetical protein
VHEALPPRDRFCQQYFPCSEEVFKIKTFVGGKNQDVTFSKVIFSGTMKIFSIAYFMA